MEIAMYAEASVLLTQVVWKQIQLVLVCFPISILIICYTPESRQKNNNLMTLEAGFLMT